MDIYAMTAVPQRKMSLTRLEGKIDVLMKMIHSTRIEKPEEYHTGDSLDRKMEEEVEKTVAEAFEEAQER